MRSLGLTLPALSSATTASRVNVQQSRRRLPSGARSPSAIAARSSPRRALSRSRSVLRERNSRSTSIGAVPPRLRRASMNWRGSSAARTSFSGRFNDRPSVCRAASSTRADEIPSTPTPRSSTVLTTIPTTWCALRYESPATRTSRSNQLRHSREVSRSQLGSTVRVEP